MSADAEAAVWLAGTQSDLFMFVWERVLRFICRHEIIYT